MSEPNQLSKEHVELLKKTKLKDWPDAEVELFVYRANKLGLDPFFGQIVPDKRFFSGQTTYGFVVSLQAMLAIAQRTGEYKGLTKCEWCGPDGNWKDVWTDEAYPFAARVGIWRAGFVEPLMATVHWGEFVKKTKSGDVSWAYKEMPRLMLAKCAKAMAAREAFPDQLSNVYSEDEMAKLDDQRKEDREETKREDESTSDSEQKPQPAKTVSPVLQKAIELENKIAPELRLMAQGKSELTLSAWCEQYAKQCAQILERDDSKDGPWVRVWNLLIAAGKQEKLAIAKVREIYGHYRNKEAA